MAGRVPYEIERLLAEAGGRWDAPAREALRARLTASLAQGLDPQSGTDRPADGLADDLAGLAGFPQRAADGSGAGGLHPGSGRGSRPPGRAQFGRGTARCGLRRRARCAKTLDAKTLGAGGGRIRPRAGLAGRDRSSEGFLVGSRTTGGTGHSRCRDGCVGPRGAGPGHRHGREKISAGPGKVPSSGGYLRHTGRAGLARGNTPTRATSRRGEHPGGFFDCQGAKSRGKRRRAGAIGRPHERARLRHAGRIGGEPRSAARSQCRPKPEGSAEPASGRSLSADGYRGPPASDRSGRAAGRIGGAPGASVI